MPNPRKPTALKVLQGTLHPEREKNKRDAEYPPGLPKAPSWVKAVARSEWNRVVPILDQLGVLKQTDMAVFAQYCLAFAETVELQKMIDSEGRFCTTDTGGVKSHPATVQLDKARGRLLQFAKELGLSPSSRGSVNLKEEDGDSDLFA